MNLLHISTVDAKKVLASLDEEEFGFSHGGRKRRRLENLSADERTLRRKLKNRVAAQTARDRKKARMEELEIAVVRIENENKLLKKNNEELRSQMHNLVTENEQLRVKLGLTPPRSPSSDYTCLTRNITSSCHDNVITPTVNDHANIVIKQEEVPATEHAVESSRGYSFLHDHDFGTCASKTDSLQDVVLCSDSEDSEIDVVGTDTHSTQPQRKVLGPATVAAVLNTIKCEPNDEFLDNNTFTVTEDFDDVVSEYLQPFSSNPQPLSPASSDSDVVDTKVPIGRLESGVGIENMSEFGAGISEDFVYDDSLSRSSEDLSTCDSVEFDDPFGSLFPSLL